MRTHSRSARLAAVALGALALCGGLSGSEKESNPPNKEEKNPVPAAAEKELLKPREDLPGLKNFAKVSDGLYRGAQPTAEGFATLKKMGVKTIVNLRAVNSDRDELKGTQLQYCHISFKAWHAEEEDVLKFLKVIGDKKNQPVFVHCEFGSDRTGMMVAVYRMLEQGWSNEQAAQETRNFGFHEVFENIQKYLKKFDPQKISKKLEKTKAPQVETVE